MITGTREKLEVVAHMGNNIIGKCRRGFLVAKFSPLGRMIKSRTFMVVFSEMFTCSTCKARETGRAPESQCIDKIMMQM